MRAVVTGGAGFLGYHLAVTLVRDGYDVILIDNLWRTQGKLDDDLLTLVHHPHVTWILMDAGDDRVWDRINGVDEVYALAGIHGTLHYYEEPGRVLDVNLRTAVALTRWATAHPSARIVVTSSPEVYAETMARGWIDERPTIEDVPFVVALDNPRWAFAVSKIAGEALARWAMGPNVRVARIHNIYGPRRRGHVVADLIDRALGGQDPLVVYGPTQQRAFCYITDAVAQLRAIARVGTAGETYNVGDDRHVWSMVNLARRICEITGHRPRGIEGRPAPAGSTHWRCPELSKIRALGVDPMMPFAKGLEMTVAWARRQQKIAH